MKILLNLQKRIDKYILPRLRPETAKKIACTTQLLILFAMVFNFYRMSVKIQDAFIFLFVLLVIGVALSVLLLRGVLWVNLVMQMIAVLLCIVTPLFYVFQSTVTRLPSPIGYKEIWVMIIFFEIILFALIFFLKRARPACDRYFL